jgi:hypothetical protein
LLLLLAVPFPQTPSPILNVSVAVVVVSPAEGVATRVGHPHIKACRQQHTGQIDIRHAPAAAAAAAGLTHIKHVSNSMPAQTSLNNMLYSSSKAGIATRLRGVKAHVSNALSGWRNDARP